MRAKLQQPHIEKKDVLREYSFENILKKQKEDKADTRYMAREEGKRSRPVRVKQGRQDADNSCQ